MALQESDKSAVTPFLIALINPNRCPQDRRYCMRLVTRNVVEMGDVQAREALERWASLNNDPELAAIAFEQLYSANTAPLRAVLEKREGQLRDAHQSKQLSEFGILQEQWLPLLDGSQFPSFLWSPPPLFTVKSKTNFIRFVAFGDFGSRSKDQSEVAEAILKLHKRQRLDFGITLGDNFYPRGAESVDDPRWQKWWEDLYGQMKIPFFVSMGNHDWLNSGSAAAEVLYSKKSKTWQLPSPYYTYVAGPAQFFALDTTYLSEAQLAWLEDALQKSTAQWKIVYGHHQMYSATRGENQKLINRLLPILKSHSVNLYVCGHDHNLQELQPDGSVHFVVAGGGGATLYDMKQDYARSEFKNKQHGFTVIEADRQHLRIKFIGTDGSILYQNEITP